jgi:hypothetical protein
MQACIYSPGGKMYDIIIELFLHTLKEEKMKAFVVKTYLWRSYSCSNERQVDILVAFMQLIHDIRSVDEGKKWNSCLLYIYIPVAVPYRWGR